MAKKRQSDLATSPLMHRTLTPPGVFLIRMLIFLTLVAFLTAILHKQLFTSFMNNPGLNGLILGVLFLGIIYAFRQVSRLYPEIRWVNAFRIADPGLAISHQPVLLAPMAALLARPHRHSVAVDHIDAIDHGHDRLAARRGARHRPLSRRPARVPRPARHLLGPAADHHIGRRRHRCDRHQRHRQRHHVLGFEGRSCRAAEGHGHGVLVLAAWASPAR